MTQVRVLAGTRKGAFVLTSDEKREKWSVTGPHFGGWEIYHLKGSPADPNRIYASQNTGWFGQLVQRSDDGGLTWEPVGNDFTYAGGDPGTHLWYDGTPRPWEFKRIWHLEPSKTDPDTVYAGAEDAALFKSTDGGVSWTELTGLRTHPTGPSWQPGAGGLCPHTIILQEPRIYVAISAAGTLRSDDGGETWRVINRGLKSGEIPDNDAEAGHCVHHVEAHPTKPDTLFMQKHWDVMRSDDAGEGGVSWTELTGLRTHPTGPSWQPGAGGLCPHTIILQEPRIYVAISAAGTLRSDDGGETWRVINRGLLSDGIPDPDAEAGHCVHHVEAHPAKPDTLFMQKHWDVMRSDDAGENWTEISGNLPSDFGFPIGVHPHEEETLYVVPITSDSLH